MEEAQQRQNPLLPSSLGWRRIRRIRKLADEPQLQQQQQQQQEEEEAPTTRNVFKSRKRFARELNSDKKTNDNDEKTDFGNEELDVEGKTEELTTSEAAVLSERRKALFEPLEPNMYGQRNSAESLLPPPDFDTASYPKGWLIGKKRKLVNVDVVESMRRIAVQEMNRKDREIDGLNVQLEEDARVLEHLQIQLLEEKSKRTNVERENAMLQDQVNMLMDMLQNNDNMADDSTDEP